MLTAVSVYTAMFFTTGIAMLVNMLLILGLALPAVSALAVSVIYLRGYAQSRIAPMPIIIYLVSILFIIALHITHLPIRIQYAQRKNERNATIEQINKHTLKREPLNGMYILEDEMTCASDNACIMVQYDAVGRTQSALFYTRWPYFDRYTGFLYVADDEVPSFDAAQPVRCYIKIEPHWYWISGGGGENMIWDIWFDGGVNTDAISI